MRIFFFDRNNTGFSSVVAVVAVSKETAQDFLSKKDPESIFTPREAPRYHHPDIVYSSVPLKDTVEQLLELHSLVQKHLDEVDALEDSYKVLQRAVGGQMTTSYLLMGSTLVSRDEDSYIAVISAQDVKAL